MAVDDIIPEESEMDVSDILTNTLWDGNITEARQHRNRICDMAGVARPVTKAKAKTAATAPRAQADDLDSYRGLLSFLAVTATATATASDRVRLSSWLLSFREWGCGYVPM